MSKLSYPSSTHLKVMIRSSQVFPGEFREGITPLKTNSKEGLAGGFAGGTCLLKISSILTRSGRGMMTAFKGLFQ